MKNKSFLIICLATITVTSASIITYFNLPKSIQIPSQPYAIGDEENADARTEWEFNRLKDPVTGKIPDGMRAKELAFARTLPNDMNLTKSAFSQWSHRGPYHIGGRTRAIAIDVNDENILMAGGVSGGIWRSTNGGQSWSKVTKPDQHPSITSISQDKRVGKSNIWYASTGEGYGTSASGGGAFYLGNGLYKSVDGGLNWDQISITAANNPQSFNSSTAWQIVWRVATSPIDSADIVFAACYGKIYRSLDGGTTFSTIKNSGSGASYFTDLAVSPTGVAFVTMSSDGSQKGIWRLTGINSWGNITPSAFPTTYDRIVMAIDPNDENTVYFLAQTPNGGKMTNVFFDGTEWNSLWKYTYISGDGTGTGGNWDDLSANIPETGNVFDNFNAQGSYNMTIAVKPGDPNTVIIGGTNLYRSTDGFTTSTHTTQIGGYKPGTTLPYFLGYPGQHADQHMVVFFPSNPNKMMSATDGGIWRTDDVMATSVSYTSLNNGYITTQLHTIGIDHGTPGSAEIAGGFQDYGTWRTDNLDPQVVWTFPSTGDGSYLAIENGGQYHYFSRQRGDLIKYKLDTMGNVESFKRMDPIGGKDYDFINPFILDEVDNNVMYLSGGNNLWRNNALSSLTLDNTYDSISTGWEKFNDSVASTTRIISAMASSTVPAHRLYIGTDSSQVFRIDNANVGQPTFVNITGPWGPNRYISSVAVDPRDADKVLVVISNYSAYSLYYSIDAGTNWIKVAGNLEQNSIGTGNGPSCRWGEILPIENGKTVYLMGTSVGLFATDTLIADSTVWIQQGATTIGNIVVSMLDVRTSDGFVAVGTHGNGIYSSNITHWWDITNVKQEFSFMDFKLFPNPTSNNLTLDISCKSSFNSTITIYDDMGKIVLSKPNSNLKQGENMLNFNVSNLAKGNYYFEVNSGKEKKCKGFIVN